MSIKRYLLFALLTACAASPSFAALIGAQVNLPVLIFDSDGVTAYDATTDELSINAEPVAMLFVDGDPLRFVTPTGAGPSEEVSINVIVDDTGSLVGGVPGDDLVVVGEVDADGDSVIDFSGVLLTGEVVEFGFDDSCGTTDAFDFRFSVTGGSLAALFSDSLIAVTVSSEDSSFVEDFKVDFDGGAKGNIGAEPCTGSIVGCVFCLEDECIIDTEDFTVTVSQGGSPVTSVTPTTSGTYKVSGLEPGDYTVTVEVAGTTSPCSKSEVDVTVSCETKASASFCVCPFVEPEPCFLSVDKKCLVLTPPGDDCDGKVVEAVFKYTGESCAETTNEQEGKAECNGDPMGAEPVSIIVTKDADKVTVSPSTGISVGDEITFTATGNELRATLEFDIVNEEAMVEQSLNIHTSCSKPLSVGDQFGSMLLVELTTTNGGTAGLPEPQEPSDACEVVSGNASCGTGDDFKPDSLTWVYSGGGCAASDHDQPTDKAKCSGAIDSTASVAVMPDKSAPFMVNPGEQFTISRSNSKKIFLTNAGGTEFNEIHTSCSQPLVVGNVFGSLTLVAMDGVGSGQEVVFIYTIENTGGVAISGLTVVDDPLGPVPAPDVIVPGETITAFKSAFVGDTSTNTVTVSGQNGNAACEATDDLTVTAVEPPPPPPVPFGCDKPIDVLTMIWDGADPIRIIAYKGAVGAEVLEDKDAITPGDEVSISGFAGSPNDVIWEIFDAGTSDKIGESKFHLSCSDNEMNGPEDCGNREGNGKGNDAGLINDWLLEGMVDNTATLDCTP